jgi:hypothetical protein
LILVEEVFMEHTITAETAMGMTPANTLYPSRQFQFTVLLRNMAGKLDFIHPLMGTSPPKKTIFDTR